MMKRWLAALLCLVAFHAQAAQRIVTLLPSLTETVCVLGHCDELVAVDDFSNWPAQVRKLPHVGGLEDAHVEAIVALKPDVVLLTASSRAAGRLQALGIRVLAFEPKTIADVHTTLVRVGLLLGERDVVRLWKDIERGIDDASRAVPASRKGARAYVEVDTGPYAAGEMSHVGELLKRLGMANIVPASLGSVPKLNPEFVVRSDPDFIVISGRDAAAMRLRPGWDRIRAVREGHVCALSEADGDVLMRPGPRLPEAAQVLARCFSR